MSGIAGIVHFDGRPVAPGLIERMTAAMDYRGPDGIDHWTSGPVALGHCQRHTTPESLEEQQPVVSADGQRVLVFDGRLDNWVELRQELLRRGARLRNRSDAELALHAFEVWGDACPEHLDGDFALALWDQASRTLFAARDRTGNRALHYHWADARLSFSTDVHALFELPGVPKELDLDTVAEYLSVENMTLDRTLWAGISMLKPANAMRAGAGTFKTWCYWTPAMDMDLGCRSAQDYADAYRGLLDDVVRRQSRALGPLAIEVSGGLDSSAIFASAARLNQRGTLLAPGIDGYTLGFRGDARADEVDLALAVGRHLGHDIEVVPPTRMTLREYLQDMRRFKTFPDMPNGSMGRSIGEAAVRKHSRVLLSGTGGDEWLGGENAYFAEAIQAGRWLDLLRFMRDEQSRHGTARALWAPIRHGLLPLLPGGIRHSLRDLANRLTDPTLSSPWLSAGMAARIDRLRSLERSQQPPLQPDRATPAMEQPLEPLRHRRQTLERTPHGPARAGVAPTLLGPTRHPVLLRGAGRIPHAPRHQQVVSPPGLPRRPAGCGAGTTGQGRVQRRLPTPLARPRTALSGDHPTSQRGLDFGPVFA